MKCVGNCETPMLMREGEKGKCRRCGQRWALRKRGGMFYMVPEYTPEEVGEFYWVLVGCAVIIIGAMFWNTWS